MMGQLKPYPAYKDSGVEWLGEVPEHWEVRAVRHITRPVKGMHPKKLYSRDEAPAGAQPYLTMDYLRRQQSATTFYCTLSDGLVKAAAGDILLLWDGANAGEFFMAKDGIVSSTAALLPTSGHNRSYLYFVLKQGEPWLKALSIGMGIPHVDGIVLKQVQICLPPLPEQAAIVRFLDYMDRRMRRYIRAKQKLIKLLEEYKQALIHQAVTGKIDVRTGQPYPAYKPSGVEWLGQVPAHWEVRRLRTVVDHVNQQTTTKADGDLYIALEHVESWTGRLLPVPGEVHFESQVKRFQAGDVLFGKLRPYLAKVVRPKQCGVCVGEFLVLRARSAVAPVYLELALRSAPAIDFVNSSTYGAKMPRADWAFVGTMLFPIPPLPEQTAIAEHLDTQTAKIDGAISAARREIELLGEYRERLIADVVTGKVDVREVAAQLPEEPPEEEAREGLEEETTAEAKDEGLSEVSDAEA